MRLLLDTHVWIWAFEGSSAIGRQCRRVLSALESERFVSPVSTLEISHLVSRGEILLSGRMEDWIERSVTDLRLQTIPLDHPSAIEAYALTGRFHADPADRMLVATARIHGCKLVTADARILAYPKVRTLNAKK